MKASLLYLALHFSIPTSNKSTTQQDMLKLNSTSFRVRCKSGAAFAQGKSCWRSQHLCQSQGAWGGSIPGKFSWPGKYTAVPVQQRAQQLLFANKALLTAHTSLLSEASLSGQPVLGTPCAKPLAACSVLCFKTWVLLYRTGSIAPCIYYLLATQLPSPGCVLSLGLGTHSC